ncbi:MAG: amino acid permease [Proteobacteria bacterium]|nr:amino acid permease [Pseudomonadota bacterium]
MTNNPDDQAIIEAGYQPQLHRKLKAFSSFAIAFSFMSVLMGIFANYGYVLKKAGPFGFWTWLLVGTGQLFVALVFAEMAGRIPLTGAIYNWNIRLANRTTGWLAAWLLLFSYSIGTTGVVVALLAPLQTFLGHPFDSTTVRFVGVGVIALQALINISGVRLAAYTNKIAVIAEIIALVVFGSILLGVILAKHEVHTALLTSVPATPAPYWPSFLMASLLAAWTIFGFESSSDLSEETLNARQVTPGSIISSVLTTVGLGVAFLAILTLAIPDLPAVTAASDPISTIMAHHLGDGITRIFLVFVLTAIFATSLVGITAGSRVLFAVARDKRVVGAELLTRVSAHGVPTLAILVVSAIEIITFLFCQNLASLYAAPVVLLALVYLITMISFLRGIKKLPAATPFSLGPWRWPVVTLAILWLISEIGILTIPDEFHDAALIASGILAVGLVFCFLATRRSIDRQAH